MSEPLDTEVRLHLYETFLDRGSPPSAVEMAETLGITPAEAEESYRRLDAGRVIVLAPGTTNIWMANPLSAVPTSFRVHAERGSYWGNCIWDALGILAMLGEDGRVETTCADCHERLAFSVSQGSLESTNAVAHFAVPAARWWENIGFT